MTATPLHAKVEELSEETRPLFEALAFAVRKASDGDPALESQANLALIFAADALREQPQPIREERWRRLVRAVEPIARRSMSPELRSLVAENVDLL
jgi:3-methyladenine DNA glycosylase/8-oxoguanine DNA glycosylase